MCCVNYCGLGRYLLCMLVLSRPICPFLVLLTRKICTVYVIADIAGTQKNKQEVFSWSYS